jgi:hypothetical protein
MRMTVRTEGQSSVRDVPASHPDAQMLKVKNNSQRVQGILIPTSKFFGNPITGNVISTYFSVFRFFHSGMSLSV